MKQRGFTLIETLAVMVVLGIAAATIVTLQAQLFVRQSDNKDLQTASQRLQECAEQVLAIRRHTPGAGFGAVTTASCSALGAVAGFGVPSLVLHDDTGASVATCTSSYCTVTVGVSKDGSNVAPLTLRLSKY